MRGQLISFVIKMSLPNLTESPAGQATPVPGGHRLAATDLPKTSLNRTEPNRTERMSVPICHRCCCLLRALLLYFCSCLLP